jgi:glutamyl-tRNA synthetase
MKERITFPSDLWEQGKFLFVAPASYDETVISKKWNEDVVKVLTAYKEAMSNISELDSLVGKNTLESVCSQLGIGMGKIMQAFRVSITGVASGPDMMMTLEILGKDEVVSRIDNALKNIKLKVA